jgi:hypothetical protein
MDKGCILRGILLVALVIAVPWLGLRWYFAPQIQTLTYETDLPQSEWRDMGGVECSAPYMLVYEGTAKAVAWSCDEENWKPLARGEGGEGGSK